ncbi:MAG TPA: 23S rRNA pseudouridine(1911/1915/1917) synthase RluD [Casimicrobiaceae bacterium]|nr:23S rRNA pseudouridine(1911/1915/1917) synthase RluD [Casimicrobiaceae bacterium]
MADDYNSALATVADAPADALTVPAQYAGMRLDQALAKLMPQHSRTRLRSWIDADRVTVAGAPAAAKQKLLGGERITVSPLADPRAVPFVAQALPLSVVYEDDVLMVIDKPAGLVVHPGNGNWEGTLANALLHHAPQLSGIARAGIVHRLDKGTTGLLVVAKTEIAQTDLVRQLQAHSVRREYLALASGDIASGGTVDAPIGRHPVKRTSMAVVSAGKHAVTHYEVRERFGDSTLILCRLETGRTHQIRVHLASIGHPLIGDPGYGRRLGIAAGRGRAVAGRASGGLVFPRQALHAWRLGLVHPMTRLAMTWESPLPDDFLALLDVLRRRKRA